MTLDKLKKTFDLKKDHLNETIYYLELKKDNFYSSIEKLKIEFKFTLLKDLFSIDLMKHSRLGSQSERFRLVYTLENLDSKLILHVFLNIKKDEVVPTLIPLYKNIRNLESEVYDLMGIVFNNNLVKKILLGDNFSGLPLRKDFKVEENVFFKKKIKGRPFFDELNKNPFSYVKYIKPYSPGVGNPFGSHFLIENEEIKDLKIELGFCHKGVEKEIELSSYSTIFLVLQKFDPKNAITLSLLTLRLFEQILKVDVTREEKRMRVVLLEWERILSHLQHFTRLFYFLGGESYSRLFLKEKELLEKLLSSLVGPHNNILTYNIGQTSITFTLEKLSETLTIFDESKKRLKEVVNFLIRNPLLVNFKNKGILNATTCLNYSITGPALRASGINQDLRKSQFYPEYEEFDFVVPLGDGGSLYDRFLVRVEEMFSSIGIITDCLENLSCNDVHLIRTSNLTNLKDDNEKMIFSEVLKSAEQKRSSEIKISEGHYFSSIEAPNGEIWIHLISDGGDRPYRFKIGSGNYSMLEGLKYFAINKNTNEFPLLLTSLDINFNLLER